MLTGKMLRSQWMNRLHHGAAPLAALALAASALTTACGPRAHIPLAPAPVVLLPEQDTGHVYHLFVVRSGRRGAARQALQDQLRARGVETLVHYPIAIPRQPAFAHLPSVECPVALGACDEVLSLPLYPGLRDEDVDVVAAAVSEAGAIAQA